MSATMRLPVLLAAILAAALPGACAPAAQPVAKQAASTVAITPVERHGRLRVENGQLVDHHGARVALRGMSLFWSQWGPRFYDPGVVRSLRDDWGASVIRAAIAVEQGGYLTDRAAAMRHARTVIDAAIRDGLYVIVDWHAHNPHPEAAAEFFEEIARAYGDKPNLIYELWNEPYPRYDWARDIKPYHEALGARIRAIDPDAVLALGTPAWASRPDIAAADPVSFGNAAYVMHFYAASHGEDMMAHVRRAVAEGAAVMVTEWGTCEHTGDGRVDPAATARWMRLLDEHAITAANWSLNDKRESCAALAPGTRPADVGDPARRTASGRLVHGLLGSGGQDCPCGHGA